MPQSTTMPVEVSAPARLTLERLEAVDLLRGLLMILMALDHTRDYFSNLTVNPTDPTQSWPGLFATRWVTHLCAPGFIALCGASVALQRQRGRSAEQAARLLFTRGLWLLILDLTVISFGWSFTLRAPFMNVISTIGVCMMGLAALQRLSSRSIGVIGGLIVLLHNLLDPIQASSLGRFSNLWILIHERGFLMYNGHPVAFVYFPMLAWIGIMCLGYAFGSVCTAPYLFRRRVTLGLAALFLFAFSTLRVLHGYGDTYRFEHMPTTAQTVMSFLQVQKYPPSLQYTLATLGFLLLLYTLFDAMAQHDLLQGLRGFVRIYGRVPFLFYVLHIYLIHAAALVATFALHGDWRFWIGSGPTWGSGIPEHWGYGLPTVYLLWVFVVLSLFLPCLWFSRLKARRRDWWLSYL
jgi:uncharacterized membrane protein